MLTASSIFGCQNLTPLEPVIRASVMPCLAKDSRRPRASSLDSVNTCDISCVQRVISILVLSAAVLLVVFAFFSFTFRILCRAREVFTPALLPYTDIIALVVAGGFLQLAPRTSSWDQCTGRCLCAVHRTASQIDFWV